MALKGTRRTRQCTQLKLACLVKRRTSDEKMNEEYQIIKDVKQDVGLWSEFGMQEIRENLHDNLSWGVELRSVPSNVLECIRNDGRNETR